MLQRLRILSREFNFRPRFSSTLFFPAASIHRTPKEVLRVIDNLRSDRLTDGTSEELRLALKASSAAEYVGIYNKTLSEQELVDIAEGLEANRGAASLSLTGFVDRDYLSDSVHTGYHQAFEKLIQALENNKKLKRLNLHNNEFDYHMVGTIADFISGNPRLESLSLCDCGTIGDREAKLIAGALSHNTRLKTIDLRGCKIGNEGAAAILEVLAKKNTTISNIMLTGNLMSKEIHSAILRQVEDNIAMSVNKPSIEAIKAGILALSMAASACMPSYSLIAATIIGGALLAYSFSSNEKDTRELAK